ncbi:MAG: hypothetical protein M5R36_18175 [Deltaproteobacteria bacterium]|nr:hypothetical protein [Deltaproteobacteria bacterium]
MSTETGQVDAVFWDGKIFVPGGTVEFMVNTDELSIYDIDGDTWNTGDDVPYTGGLEGYAVEIMDGEMYMLGGFDMPGQIWWTGVSVYDPSTDTWSPLAGTMNHGGWGLSAWAYDGEVFAAGETIMPISPTRRLPKRTILTAIRGAIPRWRIFPSRASARPTPWWRTTARAFST